MTASEHIWLTGSQLQRLLHTTFVSAEVREHIVTCLNILNVALAQAAAVITDSCNLIKWRTCESEHYYNVQIYFIESYAYGNSAKPHNQKIALGNSIYEDSI